MRITTRISITIILSVIASVSMALSNDALIDLNVSKMRSAMTAGNYSGVINAINKLKSLNVDLGVEILYFEGKALSETNEPDKAFKVINNYINRAGRNGSNYAAALQLYGVLESRIKKIDEENARQSRIARDKRNKTSQMKNDANALHAMAEQTLRVLCEKPLKSFEMRATRGNSRFVFNPQFNMLDVVDCHANGTFDVYFLKLKYETPNRFDKRYYIPGGRYSYHLNYLDNVSLSDLTVKRQYSDSYDVTTYYRKFSVDNSLSHSGGIAIGYVDVGTRASKVSGPDEYQRASGYFDLVFLDKDAYGKEDWDAYTPTDKVLTRYLQKKDDFIKKYGAGNIKKSIKNSRSTKISNRISILEPLYKNRNFIEKPFAHEVHRHPGLPPFLVQTMIDKNKQYAAKQNSPIGGGALGIYALLFLLPLVWFRSRKRYIG